MDSSNLKNKKVLIFGLGLLGGGVKAARFFAKKGAIVTVTDLKSKEELKTSISVLRDFDITYTLGKHSEKDFINKDLIIKNPAIPSNSPYLKIAEENNIAIETEVSLFMKLYPYKENIIGVTGTRGKTTTTLMIAKILEKAEVKVLAGGNLKDIGTLELLDLSDNKTKIVLELSSWQLNSFKNVSPHIAVITNIYEDHLNRYKNMEEYINDKKKIYLYQNSNDFLILNKNNPYSKIFANESVSKVIYFDAANYKLKLLGNHNLENAAVAIKVANILNIPKSKIVDALENFTPVSGRLETIKELKGIEYINDTTSTTPIAVCMALRSINKPIILIAGGYSKKLNIDVMANEILARVKTVVLIKGTGTEGLKEKIQDKVSGEIFDDLEKAVKFANSLAKTGDVILFSPGYASFGMFINEFDRGDKFNIIVKSLK